MRTETAFLLALTITGCSSQPTTNYLGSEGYGAVDTYGRQIQEVYDSRGEDAAKDAGINGLLSTLKDPESARITNVRILPWRTGRVVCGDVNAKNAMGGYVGSRPFVAGTNGATLWNTAYRSREVSDAVNGALKAACQ